MDVLQRYYEALRPPAARSPVTSPAVVQARSAPSRSLDLAVTVAAAAVSVLILGPPLSPGWVAGLLAVVAVHQLGHATAARLIRVSTAVPPAGGGWDARSGRSPAGRRAVVALAGPIAGTAAAVGCLVAALGLPGGAVRTDLLGLAAAGFLVNTLQLVPARPFDGGEVVAALARWPFAIGVIGLSGILTVPVVLGTRTGDLLIAVAGGSVMATARWLSRPLAAQVPNAIRLGVGSGYVATLLVGVTGLLVSVSGFARAAGLDVRPATVDGRRVSRAGLVTAVPPGWDDAGGAGAGASRILTLRRDQDGGRRVIGVDELVSGPGTRAEDAAHDRGRP